MLFFIFTPMICSVAFTFGLSYMKVRRSNKQNIQEALPITSENTMIVFDLHGVLFRHQYTKMLSTFLKSKQKWQLLRAMLNPCLIRDIVKLLYTRPVPESFFMHPAHNYKGVHDVLPLLISIANLQKTDLATVELLKKLKEHGFELAVLSNIGQNIFNDLESKHHDLFHMFDHIIVSTPETHYVSKPNPKIYKRLKDETKSSKHMILIDDKTKNLCGGIPFGIIGIHYKNAAQLKQKLHNLGIDI